MNDSTTNGRRGDFDLFMASAFRPYFFLDPTHAVQGCGATALAVLTGVPPERIALANGTLDYSDRFMIRFLKARGFRTLRLARSVLIESGHALGPEHVLLISQQFTADEGTWGIVFGNIYIHNFEAYRLSNLWLLRKPIMSAYLVIHPSWRT